MKKDITLNLKIEIEDERDKMKFIKEIKNTFQY